jgi:hypothetical protein
MLCLLNAAPPLQSKKSCACLSSPIVLLSYLYTSHCIWEMTYFSAVALGCVVLFVVALRSFLKRPQDEIKEPPPVRSAIPLVGHVLGMMRYNNYYYKMLR